MMTSILAAYVSPRKLSSMALYSTVPGKPRESHTRSVWIVQIQPTTDTPLRNRESHTRKCVDCSDPTYNRYPSPKPRIPHTEVCGLFRSSLRGQHSPRSRESHTRKCVDCSDPAYETMQPIALKSECSFMGHSNRSNRLDLNNPHTSVCGIFSVSERV